MFFLVIIFSLFVIIYSVYYFMAQKPGSGQKIVSKIQTGDQPLTKELVVFINADGGLSLRNDRSTTSKRLALIPNGTKLTITQELDGWYKVLYESKEGWISKQYTTTNAPPEDPTKDWQIYSSASGYKIKYQPGWKAQDYGNNESLATTSIVAFSNQDLPSTIPAGSDFIAPIIVKILTKNIDDITKEYTSMSGVQIEAITVAGKPGQKYTYMMLSTNTQVTAVILNTGPQVFILSEAGGYGDDLLKMLNTLTIG
ncbi:MAG: SH3 domain-containing protein [bacterium]